ncbi:hypothetical protein BV25DRAFT_1835928 [Artomyces pyxidatus]|uniref:Uncharacterized protein n=1 Tax=Artomyces pyxidatus TaxID=48021 RepID=A0ACB8TCF6_9AGAM|nr:hypothetical protein BV25DRAFT_1835928 [Artomyces pyxidatus]
MPSYSVPDDVVLYVCELCTLEDLCLLRLSSKKLRNVVDDHLRMSWNSALKRYIKNAQAFRSLLRDTRAVISGSTVLHFILRGADTPTQWEPVDLDIYCPLTTGWSVVQYLIKEETCTLVQERYSRDRTEEILHEYDNGAVNAVASLITPAGLKIDVITSTRNSPLLPITYFWATLVTNYISADDICITYPRLTLKGIGLINPIRKPTFRVILCIEKYSDRGFTLVDFGMGPGATLHTIFNPTPINCPHTYRTFEDSSCLRIKFDDVGESAPDALFPILDPMWTFGGPLCGPGCNVTKLQRSVYLVGRIV